MKPIIGITPSAREDGYTIKRIYLNSVIAAGGVPVILPYQDFGNSSLYLASVFDGLILSGGGDIDPSVYNEPADPRSADICKERDEFEITLCRLAVKLKIPLLGVCRGIQVMNVALGGSLLQHIDGHSQELARDETSHEVIIERSSIIYEIYEKERLRVNSFHHQAVGRLSDRLKATAATEGGVIEAVEYLGDSFALGVQWHPECFSPDHEVAKVFKYFVDVCTYYN
ncbi:MAG: gamma-glutamyl-gamma-aminobutyrate hydrolase family protein [Clostridiales bacterium]|jgi:putative glutamine amidotransferase|nr:gamma-glutamyl-gamma-aminobutyrate hydrolase family protein [Clostridiales bacterium]